MPHLLHSVEEKLNDTNFLSVLSGLPYPRRLLDFGFIFQSPNVPARYFSEFLV